PGLGVSCVGQGFQTPPRFYHPSPGRVRRGPEALLFPRRGRLGAIVIPRATPLLRSTTAANLPAPPTVGSHITLRLTKARASAHGAMMSSSPISPKVTRRVAARHLALWAKSLTTA